MADRKKFVTRGWQGSQALDERADKALIHLLEDLDLQHRSRVRPRTCISLTDSPACRPPVFRRSNRSSSARAGDAYRASIGLTQPAYMRVWLTGLKISSGLHAWCIRGCYEIGGNSWYRREHCRARSGVYHPGDIRVGCPMSKRDR